MAKVDLTFTNNFFETITFKDLDDEGEASIEINCTETNSTFYLNKKNLEEIHNIPCIYLLN